MKIQHRNLLDESVYKLGKHVNKRHDVEFERVSFSKRGEMRLRNNLQQPALCARLLEPGKMGWNGIDIFEQFSHHLR